MSKTDLDHFLELRLSKNTITDIDEVISTIPALNCFTRCRFIRTAVTYALANISDEQPTLQTTEDTR